MQLILSFDPISESSTCMAFQFLYNLFSLKIPDVNHVIFWSRHNPLKNKEQYFLNKYVNNELDSIQFILCKEQSIVFFKTFSSILSLRFFLFSYNVFYTTLQIFPSFVPCSLVQKFFSLRLHLFLILLFFYTLLFVFTSLFLCSAIFSLINLFNILFPFLLLSYS